MDKTTRRGLFGGIAAVAAVFGIGKVVNGPAKESEKTRAIRFVATPSDLSYPRVDRTVSRTGPLKLVVFRSETVTPAWVSMMSRKMRAIDPGVIVLCADPDEEFTIELYEEVG